jgi:oxygen-independent coproporphyrinogen-3 oxidase
MTLNYSLHRRNYFRTVNHPRSAYIHVPFCAHRCGYCDFTLVAGRDELIPKYLEALQLELEQLGNPVEVDTVFVGGGTPTQLGPTGLRALFELLGRQFLLSRDYEWTIEANPNDIDHSICAVMADAGVNRVSLGVQSFDGSKLASLDRQHTVDDVERSIELVRQFACLSLDLIFAAPAEPLETWHSDLDAALAHAPDHLSTYGLTYESGTRFYAALQKSQQVEVDQSLQREMYESCIERLTAAGYEHYEVSNFAQPGHRCRHNQVYWNGQAFFGLGPGAASYSAGVRRLNHRSTVAYLDRMLAGESTVVEVEQLDPEQRARERLVFGMRMCEGINERAFAEQTGFELLALGGAPLGRFIDSGHLERADGQIRLSRQGLLVSDSLWPELIVGDATSS